ncbi:hypothetical protein C1645_772893 [Glomus cerebriforme]|uniref:Uncharacterized protein n=1 Tax=Glomus cerebriforme TaxID=658196 RepID=A0A397SSY5_9GLOM|nr:hypothetical protein C1645_772893 [Glomus cerebriforme]
MELDPNILHMFVDVVNKFFSPTGQNLKFYLKLIRVKISKYISINSPRLGIIMNITSKNRKKNTFRT